MACALAKSNPSLKIVVQMSCDSSDSSADLASRNPPSELASRIAVQSRSWATPQTVRNAAIYALRVPYDFPTVFAQTRPARLRAELEAHLSILRENDASRLILTTRRLPQYDTGNHVESDIFRSDLDAARGLVFDMSLLQLANDRELEVAELSELVRSVEDGNGNLVLDGKLQANCSSRDRAFEIRYQRRIS